MRHLESTAAAAKSEAEAEALQRAGHSERTAALLADQHRMQLLLKEKADALHAQVRPHH